MPASRLHTCCSSACRSVSRSPYSSRLLSFRSPLRCHLSRRASPDRPLASSTAFTCSPRPLRQRHDSLCPSLLAVLSLVTCKALEGGGSPLYFLGPAQCPGHSCCSVFVEGTSGNALCHPSESRMRVQGGRGCMPNAPCSLLLFSGRSISFLLVLIILDAICKIQDLDHETAEGPCDERGQTQH